MATFLLSAIRDRVISMTGLPATLDANTAVTDTAMLDFMKTACAQLAGVVKEYGADMHFTESADLTTQSGIALLSLPEGFSHLLSAVWVRSATEFVPLTLATAEDFRDYTPQGWTGAGPVYYRVMGDAFEFWPTPDGAHTIRVHYSTGLYPTGWTSQFAVRDGWDHWIALTTAIMVRQRQKEDSSDFERALGKLEAAIRRQLRRDRYGVRQVRDLRSAMVRPLGYPQRPY